MKSEKYKKKSHTIVRLFFLVTRTRIGKLRLSICFANIRFYVPFAVAKDGRFEFDSRPFGLHMRKKQQPDFVGLLFFGDPDENRTRVTAVKGRCLNRLTTGPYARQLLAAIW